jgi:hypothetical protein
MILIFLDAECKRCMINFEHVNMLKSHLLFDLCGGSGGNSMFSGSSSNQIMFPSTATKQIKGDYSSALLPKKFETITTSSACATSSNKPSVTPPSSTSSSTSSSFTMRMNKSSAFSPISAATLKKKNSSSVHVHTSKQQQQQRHIIDNSVLNGSSESLQKLEIISPKSSASSPCSFSSSNSSSSSSSHSTSGSSKLIQTVSDQNNPIRFEHGSSSNATSSSCHLNANQNGSSGGSSKAGNGNLDWKITMLDGTQTVELNMPDEETGKQRRTHVCLFCGKVYNRKYGLKIHLRTHTGYKPLKCKVCSRPFSDPSNLNKHVRLHSQGDTSPYRCPYCGKILVRKRDLDRHIISRHSSSAPITCDDDDDEDKTADAAADMFDEDFNTHNNINNNDNFSDRSNENSRSFYFKSEQLDETN